MITLNDITLHCVGYQGIDDEWYSDSRYRAYIKIENHHYQVQIWKKKKNSWRLLVHLCLTAANSRDIVVAEGAATTMKELKKMAVEEINKYHNTCKCETDIENWKKSHGKKVYDKDFNYIGISYTSPSRDKDNSEYDYYNDNKPKIGYGTYYMLEEESVMVCEIGYGSSTTYWNKSEELRKKFMKTEQE